MDDKEIDDIRQDVNVSAALDTYAAAIKSWGVTDHTPKRVIASEMALIRAILLAASVLED